MNSYNRAVKGWRFWGMMRRQAFKKFQLFLLLALSEDWQEPEMTNSVPLWWIKIISYLRYACPFAAVWIWNCLPVCGSQLLMLHFYCTSFLQRNAYHIADTLAANEIICIIAPYQDRPLFSNFSTFGVGIRKVSPDLETMECYFWIILSSLTSVLKDETKLWALPVITKKWWVCASFGQWEFLSLVCIQQNTCLYAQDWITGANCQGFSSVSGPKGGTAWPVSFLPLTLSDKRT